MKEREEQILSYIVENNGAKLQDLLDHFGISKRMLYYDIRSINHRIENCGEIRSIQKIFSFIGDYQSLPAAVEMRGRPADTPGGRKAFLVNQLLTGTYGSMEKLAEELQISKNTCVSDIREVREYLRRYSLHLSVDRGYTVSGAESRIRNLYLTLNLQNGGVKFCVPTEVKEFDRNFHLRLTDCSLELLSFFLEFLRKRIRMGNQIEKADLYDEAAEFPFFDASAALLGTDDAGEMKYLSAFISSLASLDSNVDNAMIDSYISRLTEAIEARTAVALKNKKELRENLQRHLLSSYYRIKFQFAADFGLEVPQMGIDREPIYKLVQKVILDLGSEFPAFRNLNSAEVGFISAYFGGYLSSSLSKGRRWSKVLLVCPNGLTVSKTLQIELGQYIPAIEVVDTISVSRLPDYTGYYDYIISTVELPENPNVIVVHPILTKLDIQKITSRLFPYSILTADFDMSSILQAIQENAIILNETKLKNDLSKILHRRTEGGKKENPMLKDLIHGDRIQIVDHVDDWQSAIRLAAEPILKDHSIEAEYVEAMIKSVNTFGAYIVLDDYFALPHAKSTAGVNRLAMSLLVVKNEVDLLDNPVNVFMVLATVDTTSHLDALASLSDILCERKNIEIFRKGDKKEILDLINRY